MSISDALARNWFLAAMAVAIAAAAAAPSLGRSGGPLRPEVTVRSVGVAFIFWASGVTIRINQLVTAAKNVRAHAVVAVVTYAILPFAVASVSLPLFEASVSLIADAAPHLADTLLAWLQPLQTGILVLACLPPPVGSSLVLTKSCAGNDATAIFNSAAGSLLAVITTPALCRILLGPSAAVSISASKTFFSLANTVFVPLVAGQISRVVLDRTAPSVVRWPFSTVSQTILLILIYSTFCDAFYVPETEMLAGPSAPIRLSTMPAVVLGPLIMVLAVIHLAAVLIVMVIGDHPFVSLPRRDTIAAVFCASQKSMTLGLPMMNLLFSGRPDMTIMLVPLLVYHPVQMVMDSAMVASLKKWVLSDPVYENLPEPLTLMDGYSIKKSVSSEMSEDDLKRAQRQRHRDVSLDEGLTDIVPTATVVSSTKPLKRAGR